MMTHSTSFAFCTGSAISRASSNAKETVERARFL